MRQTEELLEENREAGSANQETKGQLLVLCGDGRKVCEQADAMKKAEDLDLTSSIHY